METSGSKPSEFASHDDRQIRSLHRALLDCWNKRDAGAYASLFAPDAHVVGFDGSQMNGPAEIASVLGQIFAHHRTAAYVSKIRSVRFLTPDVAVLCAVVGMVPPGKSDLNPAVNAVQTLVATRSDGEWRVAVFQNTPAAFHGRPELSEQLTDELRQVLRAGTT
jgi:uncharacterized protein (TIGR02246 family)